MWNVASVRRTEARACEARDLVSSELRRRWVLGLLVAHVLLVIISVFAMDWFVLGRWTYDGSSTRESISLWAVTRCTDDQPICAAVDRGGYIGSMPIAVVTLWIIAASATFVVVRACAYLAGRRRGPWAPWIGSMLTCALIACILVVLVTGESNWSHGRDVSVTLAPFILVFAQLLGMLAISYAITDPGRDLGGDTVPRARVRRR